MIQIIFIIEEVSQMDIRRTCLYLILLLCVMALMGCAHHKLSLEDIIDVPSETIVKVGLDIPNHKGEIHTSNKRTDIDELLEYLSSFQYEKIRGDVTTHMVMSAPMIYIYGDNKESFLVLNVDEMMMDKHLYHVKDDQIDYQTLQLYYEKIADK